MKNYYKKLLLSFTCMMMTTNAFSAMNQYIQVGGKVTLSTDGCSAHNRPGNANAPVTNDTCPITINKPVGATVNTVILLASADIEYSTAALSNPITVTIAGTVFRPTLTETTSSSNAGITSHASYDDVTSILKTALDNLSSGTSTIQLTEEGGESLEGMQLFVIWNDPTTIETAISISLGTVNTVNEINHTIDTKPIDKSQAGFQVTAGTSIAYSTGNIDGGGTLDQVSVLKLNGVIYAHRAGGYDDAYPSTYISNGTLFSAGGEGDSVTTNDEDELYDASTAVSDGDTQLSYSTSVPSGHPWDWMVALWIQAKGVEIINANKCYAITNDRTLLYKFDLDSATSPVSVTLSQLFNGEGAAYRATDNTLYAFHQDSASSGDPSKLFKVSLNGTATLVKNDFISSRASGAEFVTYSDGSERFYVLMDESASKIVTFDATNLASGSALSTINLTYPDTSIAHVSSLAVNPATGEVLVMKKRGATAWDSQLDPAVVDPADFPKIYSVNMNTGQLTLKTTLITPVDAEGLAFASDGNLYTESEDKDRSNNTIHSIFRINLDTGATTVVESADLSGDIETLSCTGSEITTPVQVGISGTVFQDDNTNDNQDGAEAGLPNIAVSLYEDTNNDGAVDNADNLIGIASSDTNGNYSFGSLSSGDYLVQVDNTDSSLASGLALGGTNPLDVTINSSHVADKDFPFDLSGCSGLTGTINAGLASNLQIKNTDKIFLGSTTISTETGHLKAYVVDASGTPATDASWDAADQMTADERQARLYSSDASGDKVAFYSLDDAAFDTNGLPTVITIKDTIKAAVLGALSSDSNLTLIDDNKDVFSYLNDASYRTFVSSAETSRSNRTKRVLATSDDGFLYAFNQSDGDLGWGWMPRSLVENLKYPATFNDNHYMQGEIDVLDLKHSSSYRSYIVGSYKQGLGQYVLRLSNDTSSNLDSVIWDIDHSATETSVPNNGKRAYFKDGNDTSYAAYITNGASANSSILHIRSLTSSTTRVIPLDFNATSTAFITTDISSTTAKSIYLGDALGNIYTASLLDTNQALESAGNIQTDINGSAITALNTSDSTAVTFIGRSKSSTDNSFYLRAQSKDRLTLFKYDTSTSSWVRKWTTYVGGGNKWNNGSSSVTDAEIQALPSGAQITDNAFVVANSIVLPITLEPVSGQCEGLAYYYLYQINDGHFPANTFFSTSGSAITNTVALGKGNAKKLKFANLLGSAKMMGYGMAKQAASGNAGVGTQIIINDPVATGVRSWRELNH